VRARTYGVHLDLPSLDYTASMFNYRHGALFCGLNEEGNCAEIAPILNLDRRCIPLSPSEGVPKQTLITIGEIGGLSFVTAPGEWSTSLANSVLDQMRAETGGDAMFIGYANDYTGYSLHEEDWFQGGYEASGGIWGPHQGDYLAGRMVELFNTFTEQWNETPWWEPEPAPPFSGYTYEPYVPDTAVGVGTIFADVPPVATQTDIVSFTVQGSDPWLGHPVAVLERDGGGGTFSPVVRGNGRLVESTSYDFWIDLTTAPTYAETLRSDRTFYYRINFPVSTATPRNIPALDGDYRFTVRIPTTDGEATATTGTFSVSP
jgi:hypothetical protein